MPNKNEEFVAVHVVYAPYSPGVIPNGHGPTGAQARAAVPVSVNWTVKLGFAPVIAAPGQPAVAGLASHDASAHPYTALAA